MTASRWLNRHGVPASSTRTVASAGAGAGAVAGAGAGAGLGAGALRASAGACADARAGAGADPTRQTPRPRPIAAACALVVLAASATCVTAQPYDTPPAPSAPRALKIDPPAEFTLPNGLRVIVARRPGGQLVSSQLLVLAGAETDPPGRAGLAGITADLLTKGTRRHSASAMATAAEALGGSLDGSAGWDRSGLSITVSTPKLDAALALVAEAATEPVFAQDELDRLRTQALDALKLAYSRPATVAALAAERLAFGAGPYGHPSNGTPASLARIGRADLVALHTSDYRPDNAVLVLAGDVDLPTARRLAATHFGAWRRPAGARPVAAAAAATAPASDTAPHTAIIDIPGSGQAGVTLVAPLPPRGPDRAVADVMNGVLGGGYSARLNQEVRIKRGLSYGAGSSFDWRRQAGLLRAAAQTKNESAAEVVTLLQAEFDRLATTPVPDAELAARKATLIGEFSRSVETTAGLNAVVSSLVVAGLPTAELTRRIPQLTAVDAADVQRYAAAHLGATGRRVVVAGEASRFATALAAATPGGAAAVVTVAPGGLDLDASSGLTRP